MSSAVPFLPRQQRSRSRQPANRAAIGEVIDRLRDLQSRMPEHPAHSVMDHDQARDLLEIGLWAVNYASRAILIRAKQSGKSAARARRNLSRAAI